MLITTLAAIASIIAAGTSTGIGIHSALEGPPGMPKPTPPAPPTSAQQQATQNQEKALISQQAPNVVSQTSGLTNPDYVAQISQLLSGTAGSPGSSSAAKSAIDQIFGTGGGGGGGSTPAAKPFVPAGSGTSGEANAGAFPNSQVDLSDFVNKFIHA